MNFICFGRPMTDIFFPISQCLPFKWEANTVEHVDEEKMASLLEILKQSKDDSSLFDYCHPGGNSLNTAFALTHYGHKAFFFGTCGNDEFGDFVDGKCRTKGIFGKTDRISGKKSGIFLVLQKNGEQMIFACPAAACNFAFSHFVKALPEIRDLYLAEGTLLFNADEFFAIDDFCAGENKILAVDGASPRFSKILGENFHRMKSRKIVFLNEEEWQSFTENCRIKPERLTAKDDTILVKKMGDKGAAVFQEGQVFTGTGRKIPLTNTVGAGDFFQGAFLHRYVEAGDVNAALDFALDETAFFLEKRLHNG